VGRIKSALKKSMLGKRLKQNRRVPLFAVAKTNRRVTVNRKRREWRRQKLGLHVE